MCQEYYLPKIYKNEIWVLYDALMYYANSLSLLRKKNDARDIKICELPFYCVILIQ